MIVLIVMIVRVVTIVVIIMTVVIVNDTKKQSNNDNDNDSKSCGREAALSAVWLFPSEASKRGSKYILLVLSGERRMKNIVLITHIPSCPTKNQ